ncbi:MAG: trypsin-like peptidase domain-containing protein [Gemmataceae bacterium]|nr:trypsin-like peptidase domain-containing protein [Gemmataceae bacterium]
MKLLPSRGGVALLVCTWFVAAAQAQTETKAYARRSPVVEAVQKVKASIVCIKVTRSSGAKETAGTGVIVDERGILITNRHVVGNNRNVVVRLHDGAELNGEVTVAETRFDLAIVRIVTEKKLQALELAPVADLMVGESVIAVGHPYGYVNTVSTGIVSALGREITLPSGDVLNGLIQTDASINPGNSGGPLLNINGELIGINVALREGAQGIAFAINAGMVKHVLGKHMSAVKVAGVSHGLKVSEKILGETGDRQRVVVAETQGADLKSGDEILMVGSRQVGNSFDMERALWDKRAGETVELKVLRAGQIMTVGLTLERGQGGAGTFAEAAPPTGNGTASPAASYVSVPSSRR